MFSPVLFLEMSAQAYRDPLIAEALANADRVLSADMSDWLRQAARDQGQELGAEELQIRRLALDCFINGLFVRAVREPDLDPRLLAKSLEQFFHRLLQRTGMNGWN